MRRTHDDASMPPADDDPGFLVELDDGTRIWFLKADRPGLERCSQALGLSLEETVDYLLWEMATEDEMRRGSS